MNGLGELFRKNPIQKPKKTQNQSEIAACEKITSENTNFCSNTVFSIYFYFSTQPFNKNKMTISRDQ